MRGLVGDRAYALIENDTGKVVSAKSVKRYPDLLACRARFVEAPRADEELPPVEITLPNGTTVRIDDRDVADVLSTVFQQNVTLALVAPEDFTIDWYLPDIEDADPAGHRDTVIEQQLGAALFAADGLPSPVAAEAFFDLYPVSVLTTSTLAQLSALQPQSRFDTRRFRMKVIVDTADAGFVENTWVGHGLTLGDAVRLEVTLAAPRCVMTTLAQDELSKDSEILRTLTRHNRLEIDGARYPCAGVYGVVEAPGPLRTGDAVALG
jgi:uncharacterized protein YcbX